MGDIGLTPHRVVIGSKAANPPHKHHPHHNRLQLIQLTDMICRNIVRIIQLQSIGIASKKWIWPTKIQIQGRNLQRNL